MYSIIYFSPTGNTKKLADKLGCTLNTNIILPLEFTNPNELKQDNEMILLYPIHGFNPPRTVTRFIKSIPQGLYEKVHLLAVGCNDLFINGAVSVGLNRILKKKKYQVVVDELFIMPLTIVMKMPDKYLPEMIENANKKLELVASNIVNGVKSQNKIKLTSRIVRLLGKLESPAARVFGLELHAKKSCNSCQICWKNCPENNIKPDKNNHPRFYFKCSMCMRCIYNCPQKAITPRISKFIPIKNGYKAPEL